MCSIQRKVHMMLPRSVDFRGWLGAIIIIIIAALCCSFVYCSEPLIASPPIVCPLFMRTVFTYPSRSAPTIDFPSASPLLHQDDANACHTAGRAAMNRD